VPDQAPVMRVPDQAPVMRRLDELAERAIRGPQVYLRYSRGPEADAQESSRDYESGLELPGLSVVPLAPPRWWRRPARDWVARQVCKYAQLAEGDDDRRAWVLTGQVVDAGPDHEPLVASPRLLAFLSEDVLREARRLYHERFDVGADSRG
jgi:hypothetical protein